ncbi:MAG TPA: prepilin peptidase [Candidatus Moranbacteria bacterium]|nr:prepilin peptidase [Candidatus Moranbacteria bacterium]
MTSIIFLLLGLIFGSFLNVVVYRIGVAEDILGRSYCPKCKKKIKWYDNIPVISFIMLKFQCRECGKKISWQYPMVEIATGILFALVGANFFSAIDPATWMPTFYYLGIVSFLMVVLVYDFIHMEIPSTVLWAGIAWTVFFNLIFDWYSLSWSVPLESAIYSGVLAAFVSFVFFFLMVVFSREKWMGLGDAYLVIFLGMITGWPEILLALFLAFAIGAICGIILIGMKKKKIKSQIPFAPFLALGTLITIFFYQAIVNWYFGLVAF